MYQFKKIISCSGFLFFGFLTFSQKKSIDNLPQEFAQFHAKALQEKLYVHTDKTFYLAGEIIWFKLYAADGLLHQPLSMSGIAYVEIIDNNHRPLLQAKMNMDEGTGNGSMIIPAFAATGSYTLRAYTNWMKNFSPDYYFEQTLTIVNTLRKSSGTLPAIADTFSIQFFPEGGNLVYGLSSKVAYKAANHFGNSIDCKGVIVNQKNDTVARFRSFKFGMGNFLFTPKSGDSYIAVITANNKTVRQNLPLIYDQGYTMSLENSYDKGVKIVVHANGSFFNSGVYLFVHTRHLIKNIQSANISNGTATFFLDKEKLGDGISHFTVFDADKHPVCERLFFKEPGDKLVITAKADRGEYATRSKVTIDLSTADQSGRALEADMSATVFFVDSLQLLPEQSIRSYLLLTSELKGKIENPLYYFENSDIVAKEAMDNLMLTQGWRRFKWEDILSNSKSYFTFLPELEGPLIKGRIVNKSTGLPVKNITAYLSVPGKNFLLTPSVSNEKGDILFNSKKIYNKNELIVQINSRVDSSFSIEMNPAYSDTFSAKPPAFFSMHDKQKEQLLYRSINVQADNIYLAGKKRQFSLPPLTDTTMFYGYPDNEYNTDDFTRFVTMEEVLKEYVKEVRVRKQNEKFYFNIKNAPLKEFFDNEPLILLDGVPIFDAGTIIAFDPLKIKKIEVVTKRYYLGSLVTDGIISFKTYEGDLAGYELDPNAVVLEYEGLQNQREFYSPVYETNEQIESRIPDFRNVLLWSPEIKTDTGGKTTLSFYSSELVGKFVVLVQGLTQSGLPGSSVFSFNVNKK
jgi:hypothetical protein